MAQAANTDEQDDYEHEEGKWQWDDPDHGGWAKFDAETSAQIDRELKAKIDEGVGSFTGTIEIKLSEGPFFGNKGKGAYSVTLDFGWNGKLPIIKAARQTNIKTGYKRGIRRLPGLDPPLSSELQSMKDNLKGVWEWKDDYGWKKYNLPTLNQIETAYHQRLPEVQLNAGPYFSKRPNQYRFVFNYQSSPASGQQMNRNTKFGRWCRRTPHKSEAKKQEISAQEKFFLKSNPHFMMMKHYAPLSKEDFEEQAADEMLKQNLKCPICLEEFEEKNLLEVQREGQDVGKEEVPKDDAKDDQPLDAEANEDDKEKAKGKGKGDGDEKKEDEQDQERLKLNAKRQHQFRFAKKACNMVKDDTVVGLCKCTYGHYFHAKCILLSLNEKIECPACKQAYGAITGYQPDGRLYVTRQKAKCSGFETEMSVKMLFEFPGGVQGDEHPNPGKNYFGDLREAYFPDIPEGRKWAMLVRLAYERKLMFHIGRSQTLKADNRIVFGSIHLKTSTNGGTEKHGYPDPNYFDNLRKELAMKNITEKDLETMDKVHRDFIENGFPEED